MSSGTTLVTALAKPTTVVVTRGIPGPPGPHGPPGATVLYTVGPDPISGHCAVALNAEGVLVLADCADAAFFGCVLGITEHAYQANAEAAVQPLGIVEHAGWSFYPGPVFVGAHGALTQTLPAEAVFSQMVGMALAPTRLLVDVQPPIFLT